MLLPWRSPWLAPQDDAPRSPGRAVRVRRALFEAFGASLPVALIDPAKNPYPLEACRDRADVRAVSLFRDDVAPELSEVAPHLVWADPKSDFWQVFVSVWGDSAGILIDCPASPADLRKHLRRFLTVGLETDGQAPAEFHFFRFYDPRVLRAFLPVSTPEELELFFGPVTAFHCESPGGDDLLSFSRAQGALSRQRRPAPWADPSAGRTAAGPRPEGQAGRREP